MEFAEYLPFWNKLTPTQKEQVANLIEYRNVKQGTRIHDSSAECLGLVILRSGQLRAYMLSEDGREITISRLFDYDVSLLSASCVMPDMQLNVMIEAEKDTQFWSIPACLFKNLVDESLAVSTYSRNLISSNFSDLMWLMEQVMWKSFDKRLAAVIPVTLHADRGKGGVAEKGVIAAVHHVLHDQHTQPITGVVEILRLDFDVLAQQVQT